MLSDPVRRKRYDTTGSTSESIVDAEGFDWSDFYREQYKDAVSEDAIQKFAAKYKGSDEEKDDILVAFEQCEGDMDQLYEMVILSDVIEDDARFRKIIDQAIESRDVPAFKAYVNESSKKRSARTKRAKAEATEAEEYAKELNVADKLFGKLSSKQGKVAGKDSSEDALAALIQKRQQDRRQDASDFLDGVAERWGATASKGKKGKKRAVEEEPSEEAFQAAAAKLGKAKKSKK